MSDPNVFNENKEQQPQETPVISSNSNPFEDKIKEIVNEKGEPKYATVEDALNALKPSQDHIKNLESERAADRQEIERLKSELEKMGSIEDFVKKVSPPTQTQQQVPTEVSPAGLSEEEVANLVTKQLNSRSVEQKQKENLDSVIKALSEKHGDKTSAFIKEVAEKNNTTPQELEKLARTNPTLALNVLDSGVDDQSPQPSSSLPHTSPNTQQGNENPRPVVEKGKGITRGGHTDSELIAMLNKSREYTNRRLGINT